MVLNAMIGAGMLAAPAKVYALAGGWSFVVLAAAALALTPLILCFADLSSRFSGTGGPYLYARAGLPALPAFAVGWLMWFSQAMSVATLSSLFVTYLAGFVPALETGLPRYLTIAALGVALTGIVLLGIRQSARASNVLIVLKVGFVIAFAAAGIWFVQGQRLAIDQPLPTAIPFAQAMLIYLFAYSGFERGSVVAGEAQDPQRDVPAALIGGVLAVTFAYAAVLLVCMGVLDQPAANDRPLAEAGRQLFGPAGAVAVSAGALAVIVGTILVITISMPRMLLALSEQEQLPRWLGAVHPRWRTPHVAIVISSVLGFGFAMMSDLLTALTIATAARLTGYVLCCISLWRMSGRPDAPQPRFSLPFRGPIALFTAVLFTGVLALGATKELPPLAAVLAVGLVLWAVSRRAPSPGPRSNP
ncbi:APC family permease [Phenylobacterium sp.]|uniref:APC family permease n=1 Tax=Phenylobacterium sp. TaxID=1871053 RepID=UPI0025FBA2BF|nr:APC family permease [Phenylobacterium sp.]